MSTAYRGSNDKDLEKIKLTLRADYLLNRRSARSKSNEFKDVSFKYILLGRRLLKSSLSNVSPRVLVEVDIQEVMDLIESTMDQIETEEMQHLAIKAPFHYYDTVKVCKRCYQVCMLFALPHKTEKVQEIQKEVKVADMNSLDYLLEDIQNLKFDMKYGESREHFMELSNCSWNRQGPKKDTNKSNSSTQINRRATIDVRKLEEINYARLTEQIFPDAKAVYRVKKTNRACYKSYIKKLQEKAL